MVHIDIDQFGRWTHRAVSFTSVVISEPSPALAARQAAQPEPRVSNRPAAPSVTTNPW
jgi:hypothetical protein